MTKPSPGKGRRVPGGLIALLGAFVVLALLYSIVNPLYEATDELRHFRFVQHIVQRGSLPVQGELGCSAQGHHPPLFYVMAAALTAPIETGWDLCDQPTTNPFWAYRYWETGNDNKNQYIHGLDEAFPWRGAALAAHIARGLNVLIGAAVVALTWGIALTIWPERRALAYGSAALVAFNPMFLYMSGAINNDVLAALAGAAVTLACVGLLADEGGLSRRWGVIFGVVFSLALLSKFNLAAAAVAMAATLLWVAWRQRQWRLWLEVNVILVGLVLLLAGWWFGRNQLLYGEPTGFQRLTELWGARVPSESFGVAIFELPYAWSSLWGRFGYGQIPLPDAIYKGLAWLVFFALVGVLLPLLRRQQAEVKRSGASLLLLALFVLLFFGVLFNYLLVSPAGPMGRFFFPALPALAVLVFYGLSQWLALLPARAPGSTLVRERMLAWATLVGMAALALLALFGYLEPAYARPASFGAADPVPNELNAQFDTLVRLRGYDVSATDLQPGQALDVDLYWEVTGQPPGDYLLFVHLIDEAGTIVAQRDTYPGLGNFPSSQWQTGDRFVESIRLFVPETAYTPAEARLSVGLYAPDAFRLAVTTADGAPLGDALELGAVAITPAPSPASGAASPAPNPQNYNFNDDLRLLGYEYDRRQLRPGDELEVTLYWEVLQEIASDYLVQLRFLDEAGETAQKWERRPLAEQASLATGEQLADRYVLSLDEALPPGSYQIMLSLLDTEFRQRQPIVAEDGHWLADRLFLARVRVQP